jgi:hypothetical protein
VTRSGRREAIAVPINMGYTENNNEDTIYSDDPNKLQEKALIKTIHSSITQAKNNNKTRPFVKSIK